MKSTSETRECFAVQALSPRSGTVSKIEVELVSRDKSPPHLVRIENIEMSPSLIEQLAKVCQKRRNSAGNWDDICIEHGYFDVDLHECPACIDDKIAATSAPPMAKATALTPEQEDIKF